jgi:alkylation response protein AidB-like acyl-CoA dehydrogenase
MIPRTLFQEEHEIFRDSIRRFVDNELVPNHAQWERDGCVPRSAWLAAGAAGLLCGQIDEKYGGPGADFLANVIVVEELARAGITGPGFAVHSDMVATYIDRFGTEAQKLRWLPGMASGEVIGAIGITEPGAGSDVRGIRTSIVRDGDEYVINGQKTYISNGQLCDFVLAVGKSDPQRPRDALTMIIVETDRPGFQRGRRLEKLGLKAQDTSELFFQDVRVPAGNVIGEEHRAFAYLSVNLAQERLVQAVRGVTVAEVTIEQTVAYTLERKAFGQAIADFQNTQFKLAELKSAAVAGRVFVDRCIELQCRGLLDPVDAATAKLLMTELQNRAVDECLQLHGGWGYMWEYPVCRAFADARIMKIAGGSSEILKQIVARDMFRSAGATQRR